MIEKLEQIKQRYDEVTRLLSDPAVIANQDRNRELGKEYRELSEIVKVYEEYRRVVTSVQGSKE
ncbi:MAG TPA: PCRF domain-containing protein, partial [Bacteroidota bacterium]|nr:PCRF domain-containing protein [Bacteroidota bacterium]